MYFRQQRAKREALAFWRWKDAITELRLKEIVGVGLEHTRRTGAAYCMWGALKHIARRKVVVAFRHWEALTLQDEQEVEGLYSNTEALVGLRPWLFGSTI